METIAEIKKNIKEYHNKPWYVIGLLIGGFEENEIKRKSPKVHHAIYKENTFDEDTFEKMIDFLNKEGMEESEQQELVNWFNEWKPVEEGDEDSKYWFLSGFINGQVEIHQQEWISFTEAKELWHLGDGTLRMAIKNKRFYEDEAKKSGNIWLVTKQAMERLYGKIPKK